VGVWNTIFGIMSFLIISKILKNSPDLLVLSVSSGIGVLQSHASQRYFVWHSKQLYFAELGKFAVAYLGYFLANLIFLAFSSWVTDLSREIRQIAILVFLTFVFYFVNKKGVFHAKGK